MSAGVILLFLVYGVVGAIAVVAHKTIFSAWRAGNRPRAVLLVLVAGIGYCSTFFTMFLLLDRALFAAAVPICQGLSMVGTAIAGRWILKEPLTSRTIVGNGLIVAGAVFLALGPGS